MMLFWLPIGLLPPTLIGWLTLRSLEGRRAVLTHVERIALGFILGTTGTMYVTFLLATSAGLPLTRMGFLAVQAGLLLIAGIACFFITQKPHDAHAPHDDHPHHEHGFAFPRWTRIGLWLLCGWVLLRIVAMGFVLVTTPPPFDDTINNWNMRGKMFYVLETVALKLPTDKEIPGTSSYPPTVPLVKADLAAIAGGWDEGLVNGVHLLWYLAALALLWSFLRRVVSGDLALLGTYLAASLPIYLIHGSNAYADVFLSGHVLAAVGALFFAVRNTGSGRDAWFRIGAMAAGLLVFTKNEALLIYLPPLLLIVGIALWTQHRQPRTLLWYAGCVAAVAVPWLLFKWSNGLAFGNAKDVTGLTVAWQPLVVQSILVNTFFEGNWLLLFPLLIMLLILRWTSASRTTMAILTAYLLITYLGQIPIYLFTNISTEAIMQTGYARGITHLVPLFVMLTTMLLHDILRREHTPPLS